VEGRLLSPLIAGGYHGAVTISCRARRGAAGKTRAVPACCETSPSSPPWRRIPGPSRARLAGAALTRSPVSMV
jgi:hypothetical protein